MILYGQNREFEMTKESDIGRVPYGLAVHDEEEESAVLEVIRNHQTIIILLHLAVCFAQNFYFTS